MNTCFNYRNGCNNSAVTEFCPKCLANGGIHSKQTINVNFIKRLFNSIAVLLETKKTDEQYLNLHSNGYIYCWAVKIGRKRKHRKG